MYQFYRLDKDEQGKEILHVIDTCTIQGDRIPSVPDKYFNILFHLAIDAASKVIVQRDYAVGIPESVISDVEEWINNASEKKALPTYFHTSMLLNGVEQIPHLHIVYIAESEEEIWNFIND
ncbi:MAG: hypothetical protein WBQ23_06530 [Bacteroidota bacterium]